VAGAFGAGSALGATKTTRKTTTKKATTATPSSSCTVIPSETGGPFPGDGSNGVNVLTQKGVVRSDIRSSFGASTTTAKGVPVTLRFALRSVAKGCAPLAGAAFYAWHCDRDGNYSLYSPDAVGENYLRGVQVSDADGIVTFQTIFPGAYLGRWPHVHFEIYPSLAQATTSRNALHTSQLAFPESTCKTVYATAGYEASAANFPQTPLSRDMVFADGVTQQMATLTGDPSKGYVSTLAVNI
jgi:protocatechuate 3,4-dioxygenase beta subunit